MAWVELKMSWQSGDNKNRQFLMDYYNKKEQKNVTLLEGDKDNKENLYLACSLMEMTKTRRKNCGCRGEGILLDWNWWTKRTGSDAHGEKLVLVRSTNDNLGPQTGRQRT